MNTTIILAKIIGLYFIAGGLSALINHRGLRQTVKEFYESRGLILMAGAFTFILGALMISFHNIWGDSLEIIVSLLGWLTLVKGIFYLVFPHKVFIKIVKAFGYNYWVLNPWGGIVYIVFGLYLLRSGFGL